MFDEVDVSIRELQWLAKFYEKHGLQKEAKEIRDSLGKREFSNRHSGEVIQMFQDEEKQA